MAILNKIDPSIWDKVSVFSSSKTKIDCLVWLNKNATQNNFEYVHHYPFLNAFGTSASYDKILSLSDCVDVKYISSVSKACVYMNNVVSQVDAKTLYLSNNQGKGVCVAIIDTGCKNHLDLVLGKNRIKKFVDFVNHKQTPYDDNGHGTFVAGVVGGNGLLSNGAYHGIAPKCDYVILKALNSEGETQVFNILDAMQWVVDHKTEFGIKVVCMSFGSEPLDKFDPLAVGAEVLWDEGIVVVCASGNDGKSCLGVKSPAISPKVLSVGACEQKDGQLKVADFSSWGEKDGVLRPDVVAPGVGIVSTGVDQNYTKMSGTSVSAPVVAGAVCLLLEHNNLTPNIVKSKIIKTTKAI